MFDRPQPEGDDNSPQPDGSHSARALKRSKVSYLNNGLVCVYIHANNFFTVSYLVFLSYLQLNEGHSLVDKDVERDLQDQSKNIGLLTSVGCSVAFSIAWFMWLRKQHKEDAERIKQENLAKSDEEKKEYEENELYNKYKNELNALPRRYQAWSIIGSAGGDTVTEILFVILAFIIPSPAFIVLERVIKAPIKMALSAIGAMVVGILGCVFTSAGPDLKKPAKKGFFGFIGRDGWVRYGKGGLTLGGAVGGAIGALIGFFLPFPGGVIAGAALGTGIGKLLGFVAFTWGVPLYNKWFNAKPSKEYEVCSVNEEPTDELVEQTSAEVIGKLFVWSKIDNTTGEHCLIYKVKAPDGTIRKAIIAIGMPKNDSEEYKYDIQHDTEIPYDLSTKKAKAKIKEIASKNRDIENQSMGDSNDRTKYLRAGAAIGMALGTVFGLLLGLMVPVVGIPLMVALTVGAFTLTGAIVFATQGPKLQRWISPKDQTYNSIDYGAATGLGIGQSFGTLFSGLFAKRIADILAVEDSYTGDGVKKIIKDVLVNSVGIVVAAVAAAYDAWCGYRQNKLLEKKIKEFLESRNIKNINDVTDQKIKEEVEFEIAKIEKQVAVDFKKGQPLATWSQRVGQLSVLSAAIGSGVGFLIGGPLGAAIGAGLGCLVGVVVAMVWGEVIYEKFIAGAEWLGNKLFNVEDVVKVKIEKTIAKKIERDPIEEQVEELQKIQPTAVAEADEAAIVQAPLTSLIDHEAMHDAVKLAPKSNSRFIPSTPLPIPPIPLSLSIGIVDKPSLNVSPPGLVLRFSTANTANFSRDNEGQRLAKQWFDSVEEDDDNFTDIMLADPLSKAEKKLSQIAEHLFSGREDEVERHLVVEPRLALETVFKSKDLASCSFTNMSPLQLAYSTGDIAMCNRLLPSILVDSEAKDKAIAQIEEVNKIKRKIDYDFKMLAEGMLNDKSDNQGIVTECLESFEALFKPEAISSNQRLSVVDCLIDAKKTYIEYYSKWDKQQSSLFWCRIIGRLQSLVPVTYAEAICQGLSNVVNYKEQRVRTLKVGGSYVDYYGRDGEGNQLGKDYALFSTVWASRSKDFLLEKKNKLHLRDVENLLRIDTFHKNNLSELDKFISKVERINNRVASRKAAGTHRFFQPPNSNQVKPVGLRTTSSELFSNPSLKSNPLSRSAADITTLHRIQD